MTRGQELNRLASASKIDETPFLGRILGNLPNEKATKLDIIFNFQQWLVLYSALETRLKLLAPQNDNLVFFTQPPWQNRSELIADDIAQMKLLLSEEECLNLSTYPKTLPAMKTMINNIENADAATLLGFLMTRAFSDVHGGKIIADSINIIFNAELNQNFYKSVSNEVAHLGKHLNCMQLTSVEELTFLKGVKSMLDDHVTLHHQLEKARNKSLCLYGCGNSRLPFFAAATALAVLATSYALTSG